MSRSSAKHRKPSRLTPVPRTPSARHRKPSPLTYAIQHSPARMAIAAAGAALVCAAAIPAVAALSGSDAGTAGSGQPAALNFAGHHPGHAAHAGQLGGTPSTTHASSQPLKSPSAGRGTSKHQPAQSPAAHHAAATPAVTAVYQNPMRAVSGLIPERIDQGVDFGGTGSVYAIGNAVITQACGDCYGWPGGGWITYRLTDGPAAGLMVFVAEDVRPTATVGQAVTSSTVIANMFAGGDGIETGWAMASAATAESQAPEAGGISGAGPFPTVIGMNFEELLQALGVPAGNNSGQTSYGILPAGYPTDWAAALEL